MVVSNTGPLLHLGEADALILLSWTGEVSIPKAVDSEMTQQNPLWRGQRPTWIHVQELTASYKIEAEAWQQAGLLESGEAEAISLARQVKGDYLALATFGLGVIVYSVAKNWVSLTRGPLGLSGIPGFTFFGFPWIPSSPQGWGGDCVGRQWQQSFKE